MTAPRRSWLLGWALLGWTGPVQADDAPIDFLLTFKIKDQFETEHRDVDFQGRILVVIGSDRGGSEFNEHWGQAIHDALSEHPNYDQITYLPVADVRGVPFFMKGYVRGKFPKDPEKWALVDFKGRFAKAYGWEKDASNILVFGPDRKLAHRDSGRDVEPATIEAIVSALRGLLANGAGATPR